jgi:hypothetical protein
MAAAVAKDGGARLRFVTAAGAGNGDVQPLTLALDGYRAHPNCEVTGLLPRDEYLAVLGRVSSALDVMERNSERELAFSTRTVEYLWSGVPPVTSEYTELGALVSQWEAGWAVDLDDRASVCAALREAMYDQDEVSRRSSNARALHETLLHPRVAVASLANTCRTGTKRAPVRRGLSTRGRSAALRLCLRLATVLAR